MDGYGSASMPIDDMLPAPGAGGGFEVLLPPIGRLAIVLSSPHSGRAYPPEFRAASRLRGLALRKSEDCFVDEIFMGAHRLGAPLIRASVPRAYLDLNREAFELDPEMFDDPLPPYVNAHSPRVQAGLGTIARVVSTGEDIYRNKLRFADALDRVNRFYHPYHRALRDLVETTRTTFGWCVLVDCHSMPSAAGGAVSTAPTPDIVLGDCHGSACDPDVTACAERELSALGYLVVRNAPYAGGFTTRHYGRPRQGVHALQVEINRSLYVDEVRLVRRPYMATLTQHMTRLVEALGCLDLSMDLHRRIG